MSYELQMVLEDTFNQNQLIKRVGSLFEETATYVEEHFNIPTSYTRMALTQMCLHRKTEPHVLIGMLIKYANNNAQMAADYLETLIDVNLVGWDERTQRLETLYGIPEEIQKEIDLYQFPLPFVIPPKQITSNTTSGYYSLETGSVILRNTAKPKADYCLTHLNKQNNIPLCFNSTIMDSFPNHWKNIDRRKEGESDQEFAARRKNFEKYMGCAELVKQTIDAHADKFYLNHRYDFRGRTNCQGYHVNYQGNAWNKACVEFFNKEVVSE